MLEASFHSAKYDLGIIKVSSRLSEIRVKHWFGNSFYLNGGLGMRTVAGEATLAPLTGNNDISSSISASSIGASVSIGNRWQWEYFTIGCDWVGMFVPLIKTASKVEDTTGANQEDIKKAKDDTDRLALASSGMLLRFYLGVSF